MPVDLKLVSTFVVLVAVLVARWMLVDPLTGEHSTINMTWFDRVAVSRHIDNAGTVQPLRTNGTALDQLRSYMLAMIPVPLADNTFNEDMQSVSAGEVLTDNPFENAALGDTGIARHTDGQGQDEIANQPAAREVAATIAHESPDVSQTRQGLASQKLRRRDPLELPIIDETAWFEWLLSVSINERLVTNGALVIEQVEDDRLAITREQALTWRLIFSDDDLISFQGEPFLPLDSIDGLEFQFDRTELSLALSVPARSFEGFEFDFEERQRPVATASNGLFLDYDLLLNAGESIRTRLDGLVEGGAFSKVGVITSSMQVNDMTQDAEAVRLETTISRDFPEERRSIRLGDTLTAGGELAGGVRFAGLQWGTNFATDPAFVAFPLPAIGGLASQDSVVDVIVDNLTRATEDVPPGPFEINNVPVVTGRGEVQLRVTDLLGRERLISQPYYVSDRLLKAGLHDYSYALGFERENFGVESFDYDRLLATVVHKYGLSNNLTVDGYGEATYGTVRGAMGTVFKVGTYGLVAGAASVSGDEDEGLGMAGSLTYEFTSSALSFSARSQLFDDHYRSIARRDNSLRRVDQVNLGFSMGDWGRLSLLYLNRSIDEGGDPRSISASYSMPAGEGALILRAGHTINPDQDTALTASYTMSLGPSRSLSSEIDHQNDDTRARVSYRKSRGASDIGADYQIGAEIGDEPRSYDARLGYTAPFAAGSIDLQRLDGEDNARANLSGSLAMMDGSLKVSRRLGRSFGLVSMPGYPDVRVYKDNRLVGRTDDEGELIVPGLQPFEENRLSFEVDDLPLNSKIKSDQITVTPLDRTGTKVAFKVERLNEATAYLLTDDGEPVRDRNRTS